MPPTANIVSGNTSVCVTPALVASCSATLPAIADACGVNASRPPPPLGLGLGEGSPLGDEQDAEHADEQDRALQEQRRRVDGDGAQHGGVPALHRADRERARTTATNAADQPAEAEHELSGVPLLAGQERLHEDADDGDRRR